MPTREDFSDRTITNPQGRFLNCLFSNTVLEGRIDVVLKDCTVDSITFRQPEIIRFETPGTSLLDVRIEKRNVQPLHWLRTLFFLKHSHRFCAGRLRLHARRILPDNETLSRTIMATAKRIDTRTDLSWHDFLLSEPKEVWDLAEVFFGDLPEVLRHAVIVRESRWPNIGVSQPNQSHQGGC